MPRFGTWNVLKVVRNHQVVVANLGTAPVEDGTTIAVDMAGSRLRFFVDGQLQKSLRDADLEDVPGVGLAQSAGRDAATARWDSFGSTPASAHRTDAGTP